MTELANLLAGAAARQALAHREITTVFRILRDAGVSQTWLAHATGQQQSEISEIISGCQVQSVARGAQDTACDIAPRMVQLGRQRIEPGVTWIEADVQDLPLPDATVVVALCAFGLIFAPRPEVALAQLRRVLVPGGRLALTAWTADGCIAERGGHSPQRHSRRVPAQQRGDRLTSHGRSEHRAARGVRTSAPPPICLRVVVDARHGNSDAGPANQRNQAGQCGVHHRVGLLRGGANQGTGQLHPVHRQGLQQDQVPHRLPVPGEHGGHPDVRQGVHVVERIAVPRDDHLDRHPELDVLRS
jgi:SAM-dependent methyltransferase